MCSLLFPQAAEGEFAFVIAVFAMDQELISPDLYASIVLAVLISTIIPPFALRFTISYFNKVSERMVKEAEEMERQRAETAEESMKLSPEDQENILKVGCILHESFPIFYSCYILH